MRKYRLGKQDPQTNPPQVYRFRPPTGPTWGRGALSLSPGRTSDVFTLSRYFPFLSSFPMCNHADLLLLGVKSPHQCKFTLLFFPLCVLSQIVSHIFLKTSELNEFCLHQSGHLWLPTYVNVISPFPV